MVFDSFAMLNGFWGFICVMVLAPALAKRRYALALAAVGLVFVTNSAYLHSNQQMPLGEAMFRSAGVVLMHGAIAFLLAHFAHHKRSFKDLFGRSKER